MLQHIPIINLIKTIIDRTIPDKNAQQQAMSQALDAIQELDKGQLQLLLQDQKKNWFHSGWRPALAWICVFNFGYLTAFRDMLSGILNLSPTAGFSVGATVSLLIALLGMGGYRTAEKYLGIAQK